MKDKVNSLKEQVKGFLGKINKKTRTVLGVILAVIVIGAVGIALFMNSRPYSVLFTGLTGDEARAIMTYLDENGAVDYRLENGDTILVPQSQESLLKAKLLMEGYPKSGFSYETYRSAISGMATESDRNIAFLQDLQDRMAAVIRCMDGVKDAVVTIAEGEDRRFILSTENITEASASVIVTMQGNGKLSSQVANAIRNLVARAVNGLKIENIAISDSLGYLYSVGDESAGSSDASQLKLALEEQVNNKVRTEILNILIPLYGANNLSIGVSSTVDVRRSVGESTRYTQPDWAADGSTEGKGIIGSQIFDQELIRGADAATGGIAGTESNSDINNYMDDVGVNGDETYIKNQGQIDYNVDTSKEQVERVAGTVADLMVSVTINSDVAGSTNAANLVNHIARAAGISPDLQDQKISVLIAPFQVEEDQTPDKPAPDNRFPDWMVYAAIGGVALLLVLLLLFTLLRKKRKNKKNQELGQMLENAFYSADSAPQRPMAGADIMNIRTEKSMELRKDIRQFAEENPEIAAQMVRSWLKGGDEKDG